VLLVPKILQFTQYMRSNCITQNSNEEHEDVQFPGYRRTGWLF